MHHVWRIETAVAGSSQWPFLPPGGGFLSGEHSNSSNSVNLWFRQPWETSCAQGIRVCVLDLFFTA
jgi:hypothetical protein